MCYNLEVIADTFWLKTQKREMSSIHQHNKLDQILSNNRIIRII